jgi:ATP-dependent Clp protease ATP-binding subunit ClpA
VIVFHKLQKSEIKQIVDLLLLRIRSRWRSASCSSS